MNKLHDMTIEERYFSKDIESLKEFDDRFKNAYDNGIPYEFTIKLSELFELCPRKARKKQQYERFISFLNEKNIILHIVSRKKCKLEKRIEGTPEKNL